MSPKLSSGVWHKDPTEPRCKQQDENIQLLYNCFLDSMLQNRPITLPTKVHMVKAMVSPAVIYGCESWTIKKADHWRIDAFEPWCCKEIKPVNPKGHQPWILEGLMLKLMFQYFGHLMQKPNLLEKTLMLGNTEAGGKGDDRGWDGCMMSPTQWTWVWANSGRWWRTGKPIVLQSMGSHKVRHDWVTELNWSERSQTQRSHIPYIQNIQNRQVHSDKGQTSSCLGLGGRRKRGETLMGMEFLLGVMEMFWN